MNPTDRINPRLPMVFILAILFTSLASWGAGQREATPGAVEFGAAGVSLQVTSGADDGPGTLRRVLRDAGAGAVVTFATNLAGRAVLLTSGQLRLDRSVTVDASALVGGVRIDGNRGGRVFYVETNAVVVLNGLTITNGFLTASDSTTWGGGIENRGNLALRRCVVAGNAVQGAASAVAYAGAVISYGALTIEESTFAGNSVRASGAGGSAWGGAIYNFGVLTVQRSTFSGNAARAVGASFGRAFGGAVVSGGPLVVNQSTFFGNTVTAEVGEAQGGAIYNQSTLTLNQSTIAGNSADVSTGTGVGSRGGGVLNGRFGITLFNSIVAGNSAYESTNLTANFASVGKNLVDGDPALYPLGNYGGPTQTMPPRPGSPALNGGSDSGPISFSTDQRGLPRRVGSAVDVGSVEAELQVAAGPSGLTLPPKTLVAIGSNLTLTVNPSGTPPLVYQWFFNKKAVVGATNASFLLPGLQTKNAGSYQVRVSNAYGAATSGVAQVQALLPVTIKLHPKSGTVLAGKKLTLTAAAAGAPPLTYQWRRSGDPMVGATNAALTIPVAMPADAGNYTVVVRNGVSEAVSSNAVVSVPPVQIMAQPKSLTVVADKLAKFSGRAVSLFPLRYQWRQDGVDLPGATNANLIISHAQPVNRGTYTLTFSNVAGSLTTTGAVLGVTVIPVKITAQPRGATVRPGNRVSFSVAATGTLPLTYQWRLGSTELAGATNASLVLTNVQLSDAGVYSVVVRNVETSATSSNATLVVRSAALGLSPASVTGVPAFGRLEIGTTPDGHPRIAIFAPAGSRSTLEASGDLVGWSDVATLTGEGESSPVVVVDAEATPDSRRFYRLRQAP